jgi:hypothetical protein
MRDAKFREGRCGVAPSVRADCAIVGAEKRKPSRAGQPRDGFWVLR